MLGIFKIKFLWIGLFLAFPPVAAWALRGYDDEKPPPPLVLTDAVGDSHIKMPVEVVGKDGKSQWVMVEVATEASAEAIPEPGTTTLLMALSSLILLRRRREE